MSDKKLIFSFKNGINLALNEEKVAEGAIVHFDLDFEKVEMVYEGPLLEVVNQAEVQDRKPVLEFRSRQENAPVKKRKLEEVSKGTQINEDPTRETTQIKSMVMTAGGELISAPLRKTPMTRTQRRNLARRKHRVLARLEEEQSNKSITEHLTVQKKELPEQPVEGALARLAMKQTNSDAGRVHALSKDTPSGSRTARTVQGARPTTQEKEKIQDIEPYIPPLVRPRRLQIISEDELERFQRVVRKRDFKYFERIKGRDVNILEGLELHTNVFSESEQKAIVDYVFYLKDLGREGRLRRRTYSEPHKWKRGKGRITIQCGCCYNFAYDDEGNPPGIIRHDDVDPLPPIIKKMIKRMVSWRVLPADCVPNSCIINIYEEGDCIPPHIDHHDFLRSFSTVSFISECNILFGKDIRIVGPGEFEGPVKIPLPLGSVLVLKGNGADIAKHCIPGVPQQRISITLRKMDDRKAPFGYRPEPDLEGLRPLEL